jgi:CRP/FNR family transcriptional regulator, cyclic AMP receptor protein
MEGARPISAGKARQAITDFLTSFPFFASLNSEELDVVSGHIDFYEMDEGRVLFIEGDKADCIYFVVEGELEILKESVSGQKIGIDRVVIATLSKGSSIGEMSLIEKSPRSATVKTRTKVILVAMTHEGYSLVLDRYPQIGIKILTGIAQLLCRNLRKASGRLADYTVSGRNSSQDFRQMKVTT